MTRRGYYDGFTPEGFGYWKIRLPSTAEQLDAIYRRLRIDHSSRDPREEYTRPSPSNNRKPGAQ